MFARPSGQLGFAKRNVFQPPQAPSFGGTQGINPQASMDLQRMANLPKGNIVEGEHDWMKRGGMNSDRKRQILAAILGGAGVLLG